MSIDTTNGVELSPMAKLQADLAAPFSINLVEVKPGKVEGNRAMALAYVDMRAYYARLDKVVGWERWQTAFMVAPQGVVCTLTIHGVARASTGDLVPGDPNAITSAEAQAFKRACASFGLGRYLYALPQLWVDYDPQRKRIINPEQVIARMYRELGIAS